MTEPASTAKHYINLELAVIGRSGRSAVARRTLATGARWRLVVRIWGWWLWGERQWWWPDPGTASGALRSHPARSDAGLLGGRRVEFLKVLAGQALIGKPDRKG